MSALHLSELLRRDVASDPIITGVTSDSRKVAYRFQRCCRHLLIDITRFR